jgi:hypothetical protein
MPGLNLLTAPRIPVLSMNWEQRNRNSSPDNNILCTTYSLIEAGEQFVNNANHPMPPAVCRVATANYSPRRSAGLGNGEQLSQGACAARKGE